LQAVLLCCAVFGEQKLRMGDVIERRKARRFSMSLPIRTTHAQLGNISCSTRDVSSSGLYFHAQSEGWTEDSSVEFVLQLPSDVTLGEPVDVQCQGRIVRIDDKQGTVGIAVQIERHNFTAEGKS
jgi:hypothetical protein